jgi:hypothetical protein
MTVMMGTVVWAWPIKRAIFARLRNISTGDAPVWPGTEPLVSVGDTHPVQVELFLPAEPDRITVYGTPLSFSRRVISGDSRQANFPQSIATVQTETDRIEVRVRVYEPGEDVDNVDRTLGDMLSAVATAVLSDNFGDRVSVTLTGGTQDPTTMAPNPDPYVIGNASLTFTAEAVGF